MYQGHKTIPVTVKHKNGGKSTYSVLSRNILHKTQVVHTPNEVRKSLIFNGSIKELK